MSENLGQSAAAIEVREYVQNEVSRRRLLPRAALVGVSAGAIAVGFRVALQSAETFHSAAVASLPQLWQKAIVVCLIAIIGTRVSMAIGRVEPDAGGSGIPQMKAVLEGHLEMHWSRMLWVKFLGALAALGSGLALGREGPTVQMGGAVGHAVAQHTGATSREQRALIAAGSGAGLAAAFNAPLAGVTFVLEELQRDFQPVVFTAALLSAAIATVISRMASGAFPVFAVPEVGIPSLRTLPYFAIIGVVGGILGAMFNRCLLTTMAKFKSVRIERPWVMSAVAGIALSLAWMLSPSLLGGGHSLSEHALRGAFPLGIACGLFAVRFLLVHLCYSTGVPGGIFAPLLSLGALVGLVIFRMQSALDLGIHANLAMYAVAGMCAMFAAIVRAPLTAVILIGEMTASYDLLLPLLITAFVASIVAGSLKSVPIYESLLQRFAESRDFSSYVDDRRLVEFEIQPTSPLTGIKLRDAPLPAGALVVLAWKDGAEIVPNGDTILEARMKLSVLARSSQVAHDVESMAKGELA
ncbi:MAG: H(+)/Cl(-) exchange transporter ClcA [Armatimonadetes bacterium]|nr:H(+)/Cl(-) exchange transporter ClcA [Armatimonadota bacterium]